MGISARFVVIGAVSLLAAPAEAIPAPPGEIPLENADGSTVCGRLLGDEYLSWAEDADGFALAYDRDAGAWRYASRDSSGRLRPTSSTPGSARHLRPEGEALREALARRRAEDRARSVRHTDPIGTIPNLVLLVKFSNRTPCFQPADFDPVFNGDTGSVKAYYREASYGKTIIASTIVGWIPLPNPDTYYAVNEVAGWARAGDMLRDAIAWLDLQGFDFTPFDSDHDGFIDAVDVIHSGPSYEMTGNPAYIHSYDQEITDYSGFTTPEGIKFGAYHTEAEIGHNGHITPIGVPCHETGHFFGLPDLYDTTYQSAGLGMWSLMAAGAWGGPSQDGTVPVHFDAWSKQFLGYTTPQVLGAGQSGASLAPAETGPGAFRIETGNPSQYFLLENRQLVDFDKYLPGSGLLIFHVDEDQGDNTDPDDYLVDLEQADGRRDLNRQFSPQGDATDPYPTASNDAFTPFSSPSSVAYRAATSDVFVTGIHVSGSDLVFDLALHDALAKGEACDQAAFCATGLCADGVCCDTACAEACHACAAAHGATADGTCSALTGASCDDQDPCTGNDVCAQGSCQGRPLTCPVSQCEQSASCDPGTGACASVPKPDGTACDFGDPCTKSDVCSDGKCIPGEPVSCPAPDECHLAGSCEHATGACQAGLAPDGQACSGGTCLSGVCQPAPAKVRQGCGFAGALGSPPLVTLLMVAFALRRRRLVSAQSWRQQ